MKLAAPEIEPVFAGRLLTPFTSDEPGRWLTPAGAGAGAAAGMVGPFLTPTRSWAWKREPPPAPATDVEGAA